MFDFSVLSRCKTLRFVRITISILFALLIASCSNYEYNGDILTAIQEGSTSQISFKKDVDSPVAFSVSYKIGKNYSVSDLPGNDNEFVAGLRRGYGIAGWGIDSADDEFMNHVLLDENGYVKSFHMTSRDVIFYGAGYYPATYTLTLHGNGGKQSDDSESVVLAFLFEEQKTLPSNSFIRPGYTFLGWATSLANATSFTVDYADGADYTIGAANADLYAIWKANQISVVIELPDSEEDVGIKSEITGNTLKLTAVIPEGYTSSDFTYKWFYTENGMSNVESTAAAWEIDTTGWMEGYYQMSLIAEHKTTHMPSGGTVQVQIAN